MTPQVRFVSPLLRNVTGHRFSPRKPGTPGIEPRAAIAHNGRMETNQPPSSLLDHNRLVMQQVRSFMSNDFQILDEDGGTIGVVTTTDDAGPRWLVGTRSFVVTEADGRFLMGVTDPMNFMRDTYELSDFRGNQFALIRKRFTMLGFRVDIEINGASTISLKGKPLTMEFLAHVGDVEIARATRAWGGLKRGLMGHSRYALDIRPDVTPLDRMGLIGGMIALDLIRHKASQNS